MSRARCPPERALSRAFPEAGVLAEHLEVCERCRSRWSSYEALVELGAKLPADEPDAGRAREIRHALLTSAAAQRPTRRRWIPAIAVLAAAVLAAIFLTLEQTTPPARRAVVEEVAAATFEHRIEETEAGARERVRLEDGELRIEVEPLASDHRFLVVTADAEVEVRGTSFWVAAEEDRLVRVKVVSGRVEIRTGGERTILGAGETWRRTEPTRSEAPPDPPAPVAIEAPVLEPDAAKRPVAVRPPTPPEPPAVREGGAARSVERSEPPPPSSDVAPLEPPAETSPPPAKDPIEVRFEAAWHYYRAGRFQEAEEGFARAIEVGSDHPLAEDAAYWRAVALIKGGEDPTAALRFFLRRHPGSPRAGPVHVMLGGRLLAAGDRAGAGRHFEAALEDPSSEVRAQAREGLRRVRAADQRPADDGNDGDSSRRSRLREAVREPSR